MNLMGDGGGGGRGGSMGMLGDGMGSNQYGGFLNPYQTSAQPAQQFMNQQQPYGSGGFGFGTGGGSNPMVPPYGVGAGITQGQPNWFGGSQGYGGFYPNPQGTPTSVPGTYQAGNQYLTGSTYDPALTSDLFGYLQSQVGQQGIMYPGQLTAAPNPVYGQLQGYYGGQLQQPGGQIPGLANLAQQLPGYGMLEQTAQTGNPISAVPAWQQMIDAQQHQIQAGANQLQMQLAAGGNLVGTPYGSSMADYYEQAGKDQNAMLAQMQQQALESAAGRQFGAQQMLPGLGMQTAGLGAGIGQQAAAGLGGLGQQLQSINQMGATNAYQEWLRSQPQYSPLLQYTLGAATTFPSYLTRGASASPWNQLAQAGGQAAMGALMAGG